MKRISLLLVALAALLGTTAAGVMAQGVSGGSQNVGLVTMNEQNGSGESGGATLGEENGKLVVTINLSNGTSAPQPAHIHKGTCANLDPVPAYPLNNVVNGQSTTTLDLSLATLMSGQYAINVHKSASDIKTYVSCGDLTQMARAGGTNPGAGGTTGGTSGGTSGGAPGMPTTGAGDRSPLQMAVAALLALLATCMVLTGVTLTRRTR